MKKILKVAFCRGSRQQSNRPLMETACCRDGEKIIAYFAVVAYRRGLARRRGDESAIFDSFPSFSPPAGFLARPSVRSFACSVVSSLVVASR